MVIGSPPRPPCQEEPDALIPEARDRQRRRRLLGAAGVAIAAALGLSLYALLGGASPGTLAQPPTNGGRATGRPCRVSQLSIGAGFQGATETMLGGATLTNTGGSSCSLPLGRPTFQVVWHGKSLVIPVRPATAAPPWRRAHVLAPGQRAFIVMQWFGLPDIGGALPPRRLRRLCSRVTGARFKPPVTLGFRNGLRLTTRASGLELPACGPLHSSLMEVSLPLVPNSARR